MDPKFDAMANQLVRAMVGFDGINRDTFEIRALALVMSKNPKLDYEDYEEAVVNYHNGRPPRRMRASDVIDGAKASWERRTGARMLGNDVRPKSPKPANYDQMVRTFEGIAQQFRNQGIDPTNQDILKENARRVREAKGN